MNISESMGTMTDYDDGSIRARTDAQEPLWSVWRQDDNGNVFLVKDDLTEAAAQRLVRDLESRGHKQTYLAKEMYAKSRPESERVAKSWKGRNFAHRPQSVKINRCRGIRDQQFTRSKMPCCIRCQIC